MEPLITAAEAARYLRVQPWTVYAWARSGKVRSVRIGRMVRFRRSDLDGSGPGVASRCDKMTCRQDSEGSLVENSEENSVINSGGNTGRNSGENNGDSRHGREESSGNPSASPRDGGLS